MPGYAIERLKLQRAAEGYPLDDIVVHAFDHQSHVGILEIQVKRTISFTPTDAVFKGVVAQIAEAYRQPGFLERRHELAIATARTSRKIDGAYQDVLTWARQLDSAAEFMDRIARPGSANEDMRIFVHTFRSNLRDAGVADEDATVWALLRRVQILVFDFTAQGSATAELARERAGRALHPDDLKEAGKLWTNRIALALEIAAGGGRDRAALVQDLARLSFRLAGPERHAAVRAAIAESSRAALADIGDRVGTVTLTRHERIAAVHAALDTGRYVEIRGDAGVGKSAVLKHFADQTAAESRILFLSPGRITPRGWTTMRGVLGFVGTARDLLADLACDGGGVLCIDNLDLYTEEERRTVVDLVREAAKVPGLCILVTARPVAAGEEPNWLPADALEMLGCAEPVNIGELSEIEIEELRQAAPNLARLLAENHPARDVTRNLYRLSRLAVRPPAETVPHTEIEMADRWWRTADGAMDPGHREQARVLRAVAEHAIAQAEPVDVTNHPAAAVDALVASGTFRDLGNDRVAFRHDVLREWAIAQVLCVDPDRVAHLPLVRPAPGVLARAVELYARMLLEHSSDAGSWSALLNRLSQDGIHLSWRRSVLLALVRSEIGSDLLTRASALLCAEQAKLLCELIRTVMAVDAQPAAKILAGAGIDPATIPPSLNVPSGPSWQRLILWLLSLGENLPPASVPDVVSLYTAWSCGALGVDPLTPVLLQWMYHRLTLIEAARHSGPGAERALYGTHLGYEQLRSLASELRNGFLLFCNRTPELAVEYLRAQQRHHRRGDLVSSILRFRGTLAQAAPAELAELTATSLIPQPSEDEDRPYGRYELREPFDYLNHEFLPASPAQGPFLELLIHAPEHGLSLIQRLVDHAIRFYSDGKQDDDPILIPGPNGDRAFPWAQSYFWSRQGPRSYSVTCGLMALEAWGHRRIEAGEPIQQVIDDVLGPTGTPAAYLLVAVDLLISHWPSSREAVMPFLGCPELLCIDRDRATQDSFPQPDFLGLSALQSEPRGIASGDSLKRRPSRRASLEQLIGHYGVFGPPELREALAKLLQRAVMRLGPPIAEADFSDPAMMAAHARNLCNPACWPEVVVQKEDGTQTTGRQYVPPEGEARHVERLQSAATARFTDVNMQAAISLALEDPSRSSPKFAANVVTWAHGAEASTLEDEKDEQWMRDQAVFAAAMIAMRDGTVELRSRERSWAEGVFARALATPEDPAHRYRAGIRYNPPAIGFVGMVHSLKDGITPKKLRRLLEVAGRDDPAAAHGFGTAALTLAAIDERLLRALLRSALATVARPSKQWDRPQGEFTARLKRHRRQVEAAIDLPWATVTAIEISSPSASPITNGS